MRKHHRVLAFALAVALALASSATAAARLRASTKSRYTPPAHPARRPQQCTLQQVHLVARHGTRNPSDKDYAHFARLAAWARDTLQGLPLPEHAAFLDGWSSPFAENSSVPGALVEQGRGDMRALAKRLRTAYPSALSAEAAAHVYTTAVHRTVESADAFTQEFFLQGGRHRTPFRSAPREDNDAHLRPYDCCQAFGKTSMLTRRDDEVIRSQRNPASALREYNAYKKREYAAIAARLSKELGADVPRNVAGWMLHACAFETAINGTSRFCGLFADDEREKYDYAGDLKMFYTHAYGRDVNKWLACVLLTNVTAYMDAAVAEESASPAFVLRYAHAETVVPLLTALGLFRDNDHLKADWPADKIAGRAFRTADIAPFAANVLIELHRCADARHYVRVLVNEQEFALPGCADARDGNAFLCEIGEFKRLYSRILKCPFDEWCGNFWETSEERVRLLLQGDGDAECKSGLLRAVVNGV